MVVATNEFQQGTAELTIFADLSDRDSISLIKGIYVILDEYLDEQKDPDSEFIEKLRDLLETTKNVAPTDFFQQIQKYVESPNYQHGNCVRELLVIPKIGRFEKFFNPEASVKKEPIKDKIRHHLRELDPHAPSRKESENRNELVQLIIAYFNSALMPNFHGYFVDAQKYIMSPKQANESITTHNERINRELFAEISTIIDNNQDNRLQIVLRTGPHYLTLDINKEKKSCVVIDAAGDLRQERFWQIGSFINSIHHITYLKAEQVPHPDDSTRSMKTILQCDAYSCSIFALDHAKQIASLEDIHEHLNSVSSEEDGAIRSVKWTELPPELVKNAQSINILKWYKENNTASTHQLDSLTNNNKKNHAFEEREKILFR